MKQKYKSLPTVKKKRKRKTMASQDKTKRKKARKRPATGGVKDTRILFALPSELKAKIEAAAESQLLETSEWIRRVLADAADESPAERLRTLKAAAEYATGEAQRATAAYEAALQTTETNR